MKTLKHYEKPELEIEVFAIESGFAGSQVEGVTEGELDWGD